MGSKNLLTKSLKDLTENNPELIIEFFLDLSDRLESLEKMIQNTVGNFDNIIFSKKEVARIITNKNTKNTVTVGTVSRWVNDELMKTVDGRLISGKEIKRFCSTNSKYIANEDIII